jgi:hypothetical protein
MVGGLAHSGRVIFAAGAETVAVFPTFAGEEDRGSSLASRSRSTRCSSADVSRMKISIVYEACSATRIRLPRRVPTAYGRRIRAPTSSACRWVTLCQVEESDLLVVGGPTHICGMRPGFSRKLGISGDEKAEQRGSRCTTWSRMLKDLGYGMVRRSPQAPRLGQGRRLRYPPRIAHGRRRGPRDCLPAEQVRP